MAQPARTSSPAASVAERDALLATKLHAPAPIPASCPAPGCSSAWLRGWHAS